MITKYYGDRIEITGTPIEMEHVPFSDHGKEITVIMRNDWGGAFSLAAKMRDVEIINEDSEPVKEKKPRKKKETVILPGPAKKRLSTLRKKEIVIMREAGKTDEDIAAALGLDVAQVEGYKPEGGRDE